MKVFSSITELQNEIKSDKNTRESYANRYPIRLLFLPSVQMVKEIVKILDDNGVERIELASFLPFDDGWLLVQDLIKKIEGLDKNKDFIIVPFSEVARFYDRDGFGHLFNALAALEDNKENPSRRIYIPLVGIYERFKNEFYDNFYRKENWATLWQIKTDGYSKIKIFITDRSLKSAPHIEIVHNTKDWLELWKKDNIEKIICVSKTLTHLYPNRLPDSVFDIDRIENPKELLSKIFKINLPIEFKDNERLLWDKLFDIFIEKDFRDLEEAVRKVFNVVNIELKDILRLWFASNRIFDKWLLKHYATQKQDWSNAYIFMILSSSDSLDDNALIENIWFKIFELNDKTLYHDERNSLLRHLYTDKEVPAYFEQRLADKFAEIKNPRGKIRLLTGITSYEKRIALELFASSEIDIYLLNEKYPDIAYYLSDILPDNLNENTFWAEDYFKEYRFSKLRDKISANLNEILNEKNKNKEQFYQWYYGFETAHQILERENVDKILLIDALGIEWLPLLCNFIESDLALIDYRPFKPYDVDIEYFRHVRSEFTVEEWIDLLIRSMEYNPDGFESLTQKLLFLSRLLIFVEPRLNMIELAPKGTGKSYIFGNISKYGWLISGGTVSRAKLFYDVAKNTMGIITMYDLIAMDEIQTIKFSDESELRGALKNYLESGVFTVANIRQTSSSGLMLLGNIPLDSSKRPINKQYFSELPDFFHDSALLDRFHGFIEGWRLPRINENLKVRGYTLNVEYFSEILHSLRELSDFASISGELMDIPKNADTRDTTAIKRLTTAYLKLLFPQVKSTVDINKSDFENFCLKPALEKRGIIRRQINLIDSEFKEDLPNIRIK